MWSVVSCSSYLLNFLNKYLEGSIYQNNYFECLSGFIGVYTGAKLYARLGKKGAYMIAFSLALFGGIVVCLLETKQMPIHPMFLNHFPGGPNGSTTKRYSFWFQKSLLLRNSGYRWVSCALTKLVLVILPCFQMKKELQQSVSANLWQEAWPSCRRKKQSYLHPNPWWFSVGWFHLLFWQLSLFQTIT